MRGREPLFEQARQERDSRLVRYELRDSADTMCVDECGFAQTRYFFLSREKQNTEARSLGCLIKTKTKTVMVDVRGLHRFQDIGPSTTPFGIEDE
ncbi:hypothetical protein D9M68_761210 [compost metagenome]